MTWEYLIGSEKDFDGAQEWADTVISDGNAERVFVGCVDGFNLGCNERSPHHWYNFNTSFVGAKIAQRKKVLLQKWNGVGLPPVGCECEALIPYRDEPKSQWRKVKVIFSGDELDAPGEFIVVDLESSRSYWTDEFRPLRSEHEIKVDGFKLDLLNVISMIGSQFGGIGITSDGIEAISHELIMLGYEKTK